METEGLSQNQPQQDQFRSQASASGTQPLKPQRKGMSLSKILPLLLILVVIGAGIATGIVFSVMNKSQASKGEVISEEDLSPEIKENLAQTFKDEAEGTLEKNDDLDKYAQGTHKLIRPGGEDQTAYLTSSVLDLDTYVGQKIKVYGETFGSSQVGWLMDVGKVEIVE